MFLRLALVLAVMVTPVLGQAARSESLSAPPAAPVVAEPVPWLVTIVFELSVKELIEDWKAQGLSVSPLKGIPKSQSITNIVPGLILKPSGQIMGRLANFRVTPKPESITVITSDGRRLKPTSVEYDPSTGYSVIEVSGLDVQPPPFASPSVLPQLDVDLKLLFQVPKADWSQEGAPEPLPSAAPQPLGKANRAEVPSGERPIEELRQSALQLKQSVIKVRVIHDQLRTAAEGRASDSPLQDKAKHLEIQSSGAPDGSIVLNPQGQVVGLMEFLGPAKGMVKSVEDLRRLADRLATRDPSRQGWIGVRLAEKPSEAVKAESRADAGSRRTIVVRKVFPKSPAAAAQLQPEDVIVRLNGQEINNLKDLSQLVAGAPIGGEVDLEVLRGQEVKHLKVKIEPKPEILEVMSRRTMVERAESRFGTRDSDERANSRARRDAERLARLGLKVESLTPEMRNVLGVDGSGGILITEVMTTGLAGEAGLRAGDVVMSVNGKRVTSERYLANLLNRASRTSKITLSVIRQRKPTRILLDLSKPH